MKTERVILSFIAVVIGIFAAGIGFYFYQTSKKNAQPDKTKTIITVQSTPTPTQKTTDSSVFLTIDSPLDQSVVEKKVIQISGKTIANATIIISTDTEDQVITPATNGSFSTTVTIGNGSNLLEIRAIAPTGQEKKLTRVITYSTENF